MNEFTKEQIAELESLRAENERLKQIKSRNKSVELLAENETLRARLAELEKQEQVAHEYQDTEGNWKPFIDERHYQNTLESGQWKIRDLFAAPVVSPDVAMLELCITRWKGLYERERDLYDKLNNENQSLKTELEAARKVLCKVDDFLNGPTAWTQEQEDSLGTDVSAASVFDSIGPSCFDPGLELFRRLNSFGDGPKDAAIEQAKGGVCDD